MQNAAQSESSTPSRGRGRLDLTFVKQATYACDEVMLAIERLLSTADALIDSANGKLQADSQFLTELEAIGEKVAAIKKRLARPTCRVGLIGEFSTGKSTLVNALLKGDVIESGVIQGTTTFPIRIRYADQLGAQLHLRDGSRLPLHGRSRDEVLMKLRSCAADADVETRLSHASLYINADVLADGVEIVDAPGIDSVSASHLRITLESMERFCDSFVILVPSTMPATINLLSFVRENLEGKYDRCIFLVTKTDLLRSKRDVESVIENAKARIMSELCLSSEPIVFGCAAEIELCRCLGIDPNEDRSKPLNDAKIAAYCAEFEEVRDEIVEFGKRQQNLVIQDGLQSQIKRFQASLENYLESPLESLGFDDLLDDWVPPTQIESRLKVGLAETRKWADELASAALVEFELNAKRELSSVKSKLEQQLTQKSGCSELASWAKSEPSSQLKGVCERLESTLKSQFQKVSCAIDEEFADLADEIRGVASQLSLPYSTMPSSNWNCPRKVDSGSRPRAKPSKPHRPQARMRLGSDSRGLFLIASSQQPAGTDCRPAVFVSLLAGSTSCSNSNCPSHRRSTLIGDTSANECWSAKRAGNTRQPSASY